MAHDHRMNPVGEPYLNRVGPSPDSENYPAGDAFQHAVKHVSSDARAGMMDRQNGTQGGMYGPGHSSVGAKGISKYMADLREITQEIGLDPDNAEHLGSVHRVYAAVLPAQDRHYLTGNMGLPATTHKGAFDFLNPPKSGQR